jgi:hypothetical protein
LILAEGSDEFTVLDFCTDGDTETVLTELYASAVSDDDAQIYQIVVDTGSVTHLCQEEVGLCGIYLLADGEYGECLHHAGALLKQYLHPFLYVDGVLQGFKSLLLGECVDIIRVLYFVEKVDDLF